jgi:4-amino-4-deoxy-L-arabinose transferase-like glycosyltransferase
MSNGLLTSKESSVGSQRSINFWHRWRERTLFGAIILLGTGLRLWRLDQNGHGTEYYSAAVRSMMHSWPNFLYNSFDPAGFVSVDKPPIALWIQVLSAKIFGFHGLSLLLPQVLEGVAAIGLVYYLVRRHFGSAAGLLAGLFLALTPISVAIDRANNTDSCLILLLLLAAWGLLRAIETGRRSFLFLSMILIGIGFNVKMMAAFVVLPTFVLIYFLGAPSGLKRRIIDLCLSGLILITVSLSWALFYDLTPPDQRPFAGSSKGNSMLELAVGHNALDRFIRPHRHSRPATTASMKNQSVPLRDQANSNPRSSIDPRVRERWSKIFVRVPVGPFRLADRHLAGQVGWLLPLALIGLIVAACQSRFKSSLTPKRLSLVLWTGWALSFGIVYSFAGGIFHFYYLATLGPPLAALAGIGLVRLWKWNFESEWGAMVLPVTLVLAAVWQLYIQWPFLRWDLEGSGPILTESGDLVTWLSLIFIGGIVISTVGMLIPLLRNPLRSGPPGLTGPLLGVGLLALLLTPMAWALSSVLAKDVATLPSADLSRLVSGGGPSDRRSQESEERKSRFRKRLIFLKSNHQGERFFLATLSSRLAAPIIVRTGWPVMAMGGFMGTDPILTPEKLAQMVKDKQIRFVMLGGLWLNYQRMNAESEENALADWVRKNGKPVDTALWHDIIPEDGDKDSKATSPTTDPNTFNQSVSQDSSSGRRLIRLQLYDLRPEAGLVPAPSGN